MEMQHNKAIIALTVLFPCLFILIPFYFLLYVCNKYIQMSPNILFLIIPFFAAFVKSTVLCCGFVYSSKRLLSITFNYIRWQPGILVAAGNGIPVSCGRREELYGRRSLLWLVVAAGNEIPASCGRR